MFLVIFLFTQIFIQVLNGQKIISDETGISKIQYILDGSAPSLHFDLSILEPNQQLIVATSTHFTLDMFLAGLYPTELKNYLFYESDTPTNENYVGSLGDENLFVGNHSNKWYIPLLYSPKSKGLTIARNNETKAATNSVLFFRIPQVHKCGSHKNVFQPSSQDSLFVEASIIAPNDSECQFTVITYKQRPRRIVIQYLETNSNESIKVNGGTYNTSLEYFEFNKYTADDYLNLNLFGSVFTFNIPKAEKIVVSFTGQKNDDHADLNQQPTNLDDLNVITSPDYGELNPYATLKYCKENACKMEVKNYNKNSWFLFQIQNRDISNSTILYAIDGENQRYNLKTLPMQMSHWIRTTNFTIFYSDIQLSNFRITYQLYPSDPTTTPSGTSSSASPPSTTNPLSSSASLPSTTNPSSKTTNSNNSAFNKSSPNLLMFLTVVVIYFII